MKTTNINLLHPVRIVPLEGNTTVNITTTGDFYIANTTTSDKPRLRSVTLADTGKAVIKRSPMGAKRTLKIILASEEATKEEFLRQAEKVFDLLMGNS